MWFDDTETIHINFISLYAHCKSFASTFNPAKECVVLIPKLLQMDLTNQPTAKQTNVPKVQTLLCETSLHYNFLQSEDKIILSTAVLRHKPIHRRNPLSLTLPELKQWIMKFVLFQAPNAWWNTLCHLSSSIAYREISEHRLIYQSTTKQNHVLKLLRKNQRLWGSWHQTFGRYPGILLATLLVSSKQDIHEQNWILETTGATSVGNAKSIQSKKYSGVKKLLWLINTP